MRVLIVTLLLALLALPLARSHDATSCTGSGDGHPVVVAAGVMEAGDTAAHAIDGAAERVVRIWPQKAPDTHGDLTWTLRARPSGEVLATGGAIEVPVPRSVGRVPTDALCLEVASTQTVTQYAITLTITPV